MLTAIRGNLHGRHLRAIATLTAVGLVAVLLQPSTASATTADAPTPSLQFDAPEVVSQVSEITISDADVEAIATDPRTVPPGTSINVEVHGTNLDDVRSAIDVVGGVVYGMVPGFFVEARIPAEKLQELNDSDSVTRVSSVTLASSAAPRALTTNTALLSTVEGSLQMAPWHSVGHTGAGQKIGILDIFGTEQLEFAIAEGRLPAPSGTFCQTSGSSCSITFRNGGPHGVSVAEIIHRMAPDAELYFATVATLSDLSAAIEWFAEQGVTIINRSETSEFDGPGDGTGPTAALVDRAVELDMIWVAAAGNAAGSPGRNGQNWVGSFNDPDGNGFHNWADGSERMGFACGFILGMRWDDWDDTSIATDYDISVSYTHLTLPTIYSV